MSKEINTKEVSDILQSFNSAVFKILRIAEKMEPDNLDLEWLKQQLSLARQIDPLMIIGRAKDKIWFYREEIMSEDVNFFLANDFKKFIKNDQNKTFMYTLVNLIKKKYFELSDGEKKYIWKLVKQMLIDVSKYKKSIGDFNQ